MPTVADLRAKVSLDGADKAKSDMQGVKKEVGGLADGFKNGLGVVTGFFTGFAGFTIATEALGAVKDQLFDLIKVGMDDQKIQAQTAAVLKSTGGAAGLSARQISEYADQLAQMSGISNDSIQSSENLLLTFRAVGKDTFPTATKAILDMSVAMHEDLQSATIQVGKALQDPIHGVTTLQRVGVQLSESQKALVKHFVETGQTAKAQGVILDELTKEFGGSAEAAGKTLPGQLDILNEKWDEARQKIAAAVIPILESLVQQYIMPLADWLSKFLPKAIQVTTDFLNTQLVPAIKGLMDTPVVKALESWGNTITQQVNPKLTDLKNHSANAKDELDRLKNKAYDTGNALDPTFKSKVKNSTDELTRMVNKISNGDSTQAVVPALDAYDDRLRRAQAAQAKSNQETQNSIPVLSGLGQALGNLWQKVQDVGNALSGFAADVQQRFGPALPTIKAILGSISDDFSVFTDGAHRLWDGFWGTLTGPVRIAFDSLHSVVNVSLDLLAGDWKRANKDARAGFDQIVRDVGDFVGSIGSLLLGLGESIVGWVIAPLKEMWKDGFPYLSNFARQFRQWWNDLIPNLEATINNWAQQIQQYINDHMPHFPGINFPSFPGNAEGTSNWRGGMTWVGENGPELLDLPPGSRIINHTMSMAMAGAGTSSGAFTAGDGGLGGGSGDLHIHVDVDGRELARAVLPHMATEVRRRTGARI